MSSGGTGFPVVHVEKGKGRWTSGAAVGSKLWNSTLNCSADIPGG